MPGHPCFDDIQHYPIQHEFHVLHLELSDELLEATRELSLIKSTHYKCRESQLSFNRETFQFG